MRLKYLDLGPQIRVPETYGAVLSATEDVLGSSLCVSSNMDGSSVVTERCMQSASELLRASRRCHCHECVVQ